MMKWEGDYVDRYIKGIEREHRVWSTLSTLFLLFSISILYLTVADRESMQLLPFFGSLSVLSGITIISPVPAAQPSIKGTSILGTEAVQKFRKHLDCFSKIGVEGHVMVVGDSINHEVQWSLMNALITKRSGYQRLDGSSRLTIGPYEMCGDILGNGRGFNISFICNVFLTTVSDLNDPDSIEYPWIDLLDEYHTKLLLLNRGAHYQDDETLANGLRDVFTILAQRYPHIHIIYRNTPPGHLDCMKFKEPLASPQHGLPAAFHWEDFDRQNRLTKKIVEEFGYTYMDVYTMLSVRPEAHIHEGDCLHYCLPGPLDIATEYLYNILLLL